MKLTPPPEHFAWLEARGFQQVPEHPERWRTSDGALQYLWAGGDDHFCWGVNLFYGEEKPWRASTDTLVGVPNTHPRGVPFRHSLTPFGKPDDLPFRVAQMALEPSPETDRKWLRSRGFELAVPPEGSAFSVEFWLKAGFPGAVRYGANVFGDFEWCVDLCFGDFAKEVFDGKTVPGSLCRTRWREDGELRPGSKSPKIAFEVCSDDVREERRKSRREYQQEIARLRDAHAESTRQNNQKAAAIAFATGARR